MTSLKTKKPHIVFLFSDTGGGHRSAAEAIIEALNIEYPDATTTEMVDFFKAYAPPPFDLAPATYPGMANVPEMWGFGYKISNGHRQAHAIIDMFWPYVRHAAYKIIEEHPCDLYLSVHPVINAPMLRALGPEDPPYLTVVTDLVSTHAFWYQNLSDLIMVPTEEAMLRGLKCGLQPEQFEITGLPVADRFCHMVKDRNEVRTHMGWPIDKPVVCLIGGGDGMGPLEKTAHEIDESGLDIALVIIAGRNRKLKARLEARDWSVPAFTYGFVRNMPDFMQASDILVTKAGPGTISEAFIAGLPLILYSKMPGQEDGNVTYVEKEGAGVWAPQPELVVETIRNWLEHPDERQRVADACRRVAKPEASRKIARNIGQRIGLG